MKFHLVNPKLPLSFAGNEYAAPMVFKKYSTPPLGLLTVAGVIGNVHNAGAVRQDQALQDVTATRVAVQTAAPATLALTR